MNPEQFLKIAQALPEPLLLVTSQGEILAINRPVAVMLGRNVEVRGKMLFELVSEPADKVLRYLQACSRSRQFVLGSLTFFIADQTSLICRCEGAVIQPLTSESPALNILRLQKRALASGDFVLLNQKIAELTREVQQRKQAQAELVLRNQELEQTIDKNELLKQTLCELKKLQSQLVQTEKMSSLSKLVAGVAHEINNPVSFIYGNIEPASEYIEALLRLIEIYQQEYPSTPRIQEEIEALDFDFVKEDIKRLLESMRVGTERISEIVKSLRNFSRLDEAEVKKVDIHEGIDSTLMILENRLKPAPDRPQIHVVKQYGLLPLINCYPGLMNQVFMNILSNAIDALEERYICETLEQIEANPSTISICTKIDDYRITIQISDNGCGIPEKFIQQIFDPFYTTKPVGKGTGLGLSISYQIITGQHKGQLYCFSKPGQQTQFTIEIPIN